MSYACVCVHAREESLELLIALIPPPVPLPPLKRVIRIFKLGRYTDGSSLLRETLRASSAAVGLMAFFMIVLTLLFASIVYFAEMGKFKVTPVSPLSLFPSLAPASLLCAEWLDL